MADLAALTPPQLLVLTVIDNGSFAVNRREAFAADRAETPHTIGLRDAFDFALANGLIEIDRYRLSEAGERALLRAKGGDNG